MKAWQRVDRLNEYTAHPYRIAASENPNGGQWYNVYYAGEFLGRLDDAQEARDLAELHERSQRG